jgi:hypothetical protein
MMRVGRPRQRFRSALLEKALDPEPLGSDSFEIEFWRARAGDDDEVHPARQEVRVGPKTLAAEAFHTVSLHRPPDPAAHDQPEARRPRLALRSQEEGEMGGSDPTSGAIGLGPCEVRVLAEPAIGAEGHLTCAGANVLRAPPRLLLVEGRNQPLAPLAAAIREHLATTSGGHAGAKAVRACAADIVGLIGALHGVPRFRRDKRASERRSVKCLPSRHLLVRPSHALFYSAARMTRPHRSYLPLALAVDHGLS